MKKILISVLTLVFLSFACTSFAQKDKPKGKDSVKTEVSQKDKDNNKDKSKENQGQGNAYGKNKGDLSGKEFGQNRAEDAKNKDEAVTITQNNINQVATTNTDTKEKIKQAREKLEKKFKNKELTKAEYEKKKKAIDDLEIEVNTLETKSKEVKENLDKEKEVITK